MCEVVFVGLTEVAIVLGWEVDLDTTGIGVLERGEDVGVGNEVCTVVLNVDARDVFVIGMVVDPRENFEVVTMVVGIEGNFVGSVEVIGFEVEINDV